MKSIIGPTDSYPWPLLRFRFPTKIQEYTAALEKAGVSYKLGGKAKPLGCDIINIEFLDCSGFIQDVLFRTLGRPGDYSIPDGSSNQHEWAIKQGFKLSTPADALNHDDYWRLAFLSPEDGGGIGHVLLIFQGMTFESHAHHGPGSRRWMSEPKWMSLCSVYVVSRV